MKYLNDYIQDTQTMLMNKAGAFFAFSDKQFNTQKQDGVEYVSMGMGLICPKGNAANLLSAMEDNYKQGIEQDIQENGIDKIIKRELANHEYGITYDITDTMESLRGYGVTDTQVQRIANTMDWDY